jgi:predicted nucleic acid-binding protein
MALIISDTTTPIILAKTNHLDLLSNFVEIVYIPPAVKEELSQKNDGVKSWMFALLTMVLFLKRF